MSAVRRRWSLVEADLGEPRGHEQGLRRPVLIVSNEAFNRTLGPFDGIAGHVCQAWTLTPAIRGLPAGGSRRQSIGSIILPHQIRTISAGRLERLHSRLSDPALRREVAEKVLRHLEFLDLLEVEEEP